MLYDFSIFRARSSTQLPRRQLKTEPDLLPLPYAILAGSVGGFSQARPVRCHPSRSKEREDGGDSLEWLWETERGVGFLF